MKREDRCYARLKHLLARYHSAVVSWLWQLKSNNEQLDEMTEDVLKRGFLTHSSPKIQSELHSEQM